MHHISKTKQLQSKPELSGKNGHSDSITTLINLSKAHCVPGGGKEALNYAQQAASVCEALHGKMHHDFAAALYNLGSVHHYCGNYNASATCRKEALNIYEKLFSEHPYVSLSLDNQDITQQHI